MKEKINKFLLLLFQNDLNILSIFFFLSFAVWHPILSNDFLNDDFQILGWLKPKVFADVFKPFYEKEPILFYWRPIVNSINSLTIFLFGFHPLPFLAQNLIIYSLICFLIYKILKIFEVNANISFWGALMFFVIPSHDMPIAWIACRYDLFMTLFILIVILFYIKIIHRRNKRYYWAYIFLAIFSFLSIFSKEHSFFLPAFGLIMIIINQNNQKEHVIFVFITSFFIAFYFLSRAMFIGGNPFSSSNFSNFNFINIISNFFLYLITSVIHSEFLLKYIQSKELDVIFIIQLIFIFLIIFHLFFLFLKSRNNISFSIKIKSTKSQRINLCLFGLLLYFISIIPVLPLFMRWYAFFPFIGIIFFLTGIIHQINKNLELKDIKDISPNKRKLFKRLRLFWSFVFIYALTCIIFNYTQAGKWNCASKEVTNVLSSLNNIEIDGADTLTLWGIPDKIEGISAMRLGVEQAVHFVIENDRLNIKSPLRIESNKGYSLILKKNNDSTFIIILYGGILRHQFSDRIEIDSIFIENDEYNLKIINNTYYKETSGRAELMFKRSNFGNINYLWTGKKFIRF